MAHKIYLIGIGPDGLTAKAGALMAACPVVVASSRHRHLVPAGKEIIAIAPVQQTLELVAQRLATGNVAVLASGDPLFFGIGRTLLKTVGSEKLEVHPALSSVQLAFSRFKEPWDDAAFVSLHGREAEHILPLVLPHDKVLVFTDGINSPDALCRQLLTCLSAVDDKETMDRYQVMVAENLGQENERLTSGSLGEISGQSFSPLNVVIFKRQPTPRPFRLGLETDTIQHSRGLITKDEVRAATLHKLQLPEQGVLWDIGAGSGSVAIEAARLCPGLMIYAIERHPEELANIKANIRTYHCHTVQVVEGMAPEALADLPAPDRVFIGGSGGNLAEIIALAAGKLKNDGIMVANAVLTKTAEAAPALMIEQGLHVDIAEISVIRKNESQNEEMSPITIIRGKKQAALPV
ncbi:MAG: precorrin-6y C5,15-methyltransferase (decarboxylating) subunit CbiE [Proteobacteria bacterium]|nr:precorrin-6y C5,15-methyltransferase (decarboxylating) subunit CbiE [Pseudomonadota bacterium]MBU1639147.1 precorrin-6y C5,15-methyltransferase (decarboxylating) subunit CbiE [Pseudomonadota bacterium]